MESRMESRIDGIVHVALALALVGALAATTIALVPSADELMDMLCCHAVQRI